MAHEYLHWLASHEGGAFLPSWFDEGFAVAVSWLLEGNVSNWADATNWESINRWSALAAADPTIEVPRLSERFGVSDEATAAAHLLLQTRGQGALAGFFRTTRAQREQGRQDFEEAFSQAFGSTPTGFQDEFAATVRQRREDWHRVSGRPPASATASACDDGGAPVSSVPRAFLYMPDVFDIRTTNGSTGAYAAPASVSTFARPQAALLAMGFVVGRRGEMVVATNGPKGVAERRETIPLSTLPLGRGFTYLAPALTVRTDERGAYRTLVTVNGNVAACVEWTVR